MRTGGGAARAGLPSQDFTRPSPGARFRNRRTATAPCRRAARLPKISAMAPEFIRLVWGNPSVPAGRWHAGLLNLKFAPKGATLANAAANPDPWLAFRTHRPHVSLRGVLLWAFGLLLVAHCAGAFVIQRRLERASPRNRVAYADLAFPWRWRHLDRLRGEALVADGRELIAARRVPEGLALLRQGLERNPADAGARLDIARTFAAMRLAPRAGKLLREALDHGYPGREAMEFAFTLAAEADAPDARIELCRLARERFLALPAEARAPDEAAWLDLQLALASRPRRSKLWRRAHPATRPRSPLPGSPPSREIRNPCACSPTRFSRPATSPAPRTFSQSCARSSPTNHERWSSPTRGSTPTATPRPRKKPSMNSSCATARCPRSTKPSPPCSPRPKTRSPWRESNVNSASVDSPCGPPCAPGFKSPSANAIGSAPSPPPNVCAPSPAPR
jgi:tetratricopeptide (TPR) repeat protein